MQGQMSKVVFGGREILYFFELRHRKKFSIKGKPSSMILASQVIDLACIFNDEVSAMRTHVGETMKLTFLVARQQYRFVEIILENMNWCYPACFAYLVGIAYKLPALRKDLFLRLFQILCFVVEIRSKRSRF